MLRLGGGEHGHEGLAERPFGEQPAKEVGNADLDSASENLVLIDEEALPEAVRSDPAAWAACYGGAVPEAEYVAAARRAGFETVEVLERSEPYEKGGVRIRSLTLKGTKGTTR